MTSGTKYYLRDYVDSNTLFFLESDRNQLTKDNVFGQKRINLRWTNGNYINECYLTSKFTYASINYGYRYLYGILITSDTRFYIIEMYVDGNTSSWWVKPHQVNV